MATIKPKADASAKTDPKPDKQSRWERGFAILSSGKVSLEEFMKQTGATERAARGTIDIWNSAIHALDKRMALSVDPATLIHDAGARESGSQRAIRILATEGVDIDVAELASRASVSQATARRTVELYRSVVAAQATNKNATNGTKGKAA